MSLKKFLERSNNAIEGILHTAKTQRHLRYHLYIAAFVLIVAYILGIGRTDFLIISIAVILVLLAEKALLNQQVDGRRCGIGELSLENSDCTRVLLAAKDELLFLFALSHVRPDRQHHAHQDRHYAQAHQQRGHSVASLTLKGRCSAGALTL